ncbi:MAG: hypothetical protein D3909_17430 [Candidatus Electrothrix sp. ATG1]|nr:hypothetical protein [Candidatus Electrothrix sp. ATG1]
MIKSAVFFMPLLQHYPNICSSIHLHDQLSGKGYFLLLSQQPVIITKKYATMHRLTDKTALLITTLS